MQAAVGRDAIRRRTARRYAATCSELSSEPVIDARTVSMITSRIGGFAARASSSAREARTAGDASRERIGRPNDVQMLEPMAGDVPQRGDPQAERVALIREIHDRPRAD